jgi:general L-amino acid transport system substrate-binding protein
MISAAIRRTGGEQSPPVLRLVLTIASAVFTALGLWAGQVAQAGTVEDIRKTGKLTCGLVMEPDDWNLVEHHGDIHEFGAEFCKAVGVAILGDAARIGYRSYPGEEDALVGLAHGEVDLAAGVTPSSKAQIIYKSQFSPTIFWDAQGFMVNRVSGIAQPADLAGKNVCSLGSHEAEATANSWLADHHVNFHPSPFSEQGEMDAALIGGRCAAETADITVLAFSREQFHARTKDFVILPQTISIDPIALAYRQNDARFGAIVDWTVNALIQAEAEGITKANVTAARDDQSPSRQRLLGTDWASSLSLGLDKPWAVRVIAAVGNYGEIYGRTVGAQSTLNIPRGLNALWRDGGILAPAPVR